MYRETAADGTTRLVGAGIPTRLGSTSIWIVGSSTHVDAFFPDGGPPRIGDWLVSLNGYSRGDIYNITRVYDDGYVDIASSGQYFQLREDTDWLNVGAVNNPAYVNGWTSINAAGPDWGPPAFRKKNGVVYLRGLVKYSAAIAAGQTSVPIFTLPGGFRPGSSLGQHFTVANGQNTIARIQVTDTGIVQTNFAGTAFVANQWWGLDDISFIAA